MLLPVLLLSMVSSMFDGFSMSCQEAGAGAHRTRLVNRRDLEVNGRRRTSDAQFWIHREDLVRRAGLLFRLGACARSGGGRVARRDGGGRAFVGPPDLASVEVDILGGEPLVKPCELFGNFNLFHDHDARTDLSCHHLQRFEGLFEESARESNQETIVSHSEFVAGLTAAFEKTPLELGDESGESSRSGVYELELVLDVTLKVHVRCASRER